MNLKEAFRYQNYLTYLHSEMMRYFGDKLNLVRVTENHLRTNANPYAENETIDATKERPYEYTNDALIGFMADVMNEKYALSLAIGRAKAACPVDIDAETSCNSIRRNAANMLNGIAAIRSGKTKKLEQAYKLNEAGDQVPYYYEVEVDTAIDFGPEKVKRMARMLLEIADESSADIDRYMITTDVDFNPRFNVLDSTEDAINYYFQADARAD